MIKRFGILLFLCVVALFISCDDDDDDDDTIVTFGSVDRSVTCDVNLSNKHLIFSDKSNGDVFSIPCSKINLLSDSTYNVSRNLISRTYDGGNGRASSTSTFSAKFSICDDGNILNIIARPDNNESIYLFRNYKEPTVVFTSKQADGTSLILTFNTYQKTAVLAQKDSGDLYTIAQGAYSSGNPRLDGTFNVTIPASDPDSKDEDKNKDKTMECTISKSGKILVEMIDNKDKNTFSKSS